jgi:hypothetical protein
MIKGRSMNNIVMILILLISLTWVPSVYAKNFQVKNIGEDGQTVVIKDNETNMEWEVKKGDDIDGWTVIEMDRDKVILEKQPDDELQPMYEQVELIIPNPKGTIVKQKNK